MFESAAIANGIIGGVLIGIASVALLALDGRIAGVSGILGGLLTPAVPGDRGWRVAFVLGLPVGPVLLESAGRPVAVHLAANGAWLIVAALLVGFGTRLGSGCTSGHGVCGIARRSKRSLAATGVFMLVAMLTTYVTRHVLP